MARNLDIRRLTPALGAEIHGVDLAGGLDEATFAALRQALLDHLVIFLPGQTIAPADQVAFARRFGPIEPPHPVFPKVEEQPEITIIEQWGNKGDLYNDEWHTDVTWRATPPMATMLYCKEVPESGGDTLWASMYAAWEALSPPLRAMLEPLDAIHEFYQAFGEIVLAAPDGVARLARTLDEHPPVRHPVVPRHPETGRQLLYINRGFTNRIEGLSRVESRGLLDLLIEHNEHPNFQMRHRWQPGTLGMWDNRCTMHLATSDFTGHRLMHRITILGERPRR